MVNDQSVHVIVLGDLSRSPRILQHALFLARERWIVTMSGYGKKSDIHRANAINVIPIYNVGDWNSRFIPSWMSLILKLLMLAVILLCHLIRHCRSRVVLLQNPPAVPTFIVAWLFTRLSRKRLVIDWHNYGYTILELSTGKKSLPSRIYRWFELNFASRFFAGISKRVQHICVSTSMKDDLKSYGISASVFYDRPPDDFKPTRLEEAHDLFSRLQHQYTVFADPDGSMRRTRFTEVNALPASLGGGRTQWRTDRPSLVVSSCSWTLDDDFGLMMEALTVYDGKASQPGSRLPELLAVVTGRGPMQAFYKSEMEKLNWKHVSVLTAWLDASDYPVLLGCADLGVSLHRSSSGLDLPMKVVDMIGVELPVLALTYPTLYELLPAGRFGCHFETAHQLGGLLCTLLQPLSKTYGDGTDRRQLSIYRDQLAEYNRQTPRGYSHWRSAALPIFKSALSN